MGHLLPGQKTEQHAFKRTRVKRSKQRRTSIHEDKYDSKAAAARRKNELERLGEQSETTFNLYTSIKGEVTKEDLIEMCGGDPIPLEHLETSSSGIVDSKAWLSFVRYACEALKPHVIDANIANVLSYTRLKMDSVLGSLWVRAQIHTMLDKTLMPLAKSIFEETCALHGVTPYHGIAQEVLNTTLGDYGLFAEIDTDDNGYVDLDEWMSFIEGSCEDRGEAGRTWLQSFVLSYNGPPVAWYDLRLARMMKEAADVYFGLAAAACVDGTFTGVGKEMLVAAHGGDFGIFEAWVTEPLSGLILSSLILNQSHQSNLIIIISILEGFRRGWLR